MEKEIKKEQKLNNKGFSLVELIIVMAIMAILVGVVGTQVIPYMNNAKESKDYQIISTFGTAAVTAATEYADKMEKDTYTINLYTGAGATDFEQKVIAKIKELTYSEVGDKSKGLQKDLKSKEGDKVTDIKIVITKTKVTVTATGANFEPVESTIGQ